MKNEKELNPIVESDNDTCGWVSDNVYVDRKEWVELREKRQNILDREQEYLNLERSAETKEIWEITLDIVKFHENAALPKYAHEFDSGADLVATSKWEDKEGNTCYGIGWGVQIPIGYVGLIFPRSSNADTDLRLTNSVGCIDPPYQGEIKMKFRNDWTALANYKSRESDFINIEGKNSDWQIGDRIGQLILVRRPLLKFNVVEKFKSVTDRGTGGHGSSGKS